MRTAIEVEPFDLYENAPCGYHSVGPDGTLLRMNRTELGWLGFRDDELVGRLRYSTAVAASGRGDYDRALQDLHDGLSCAVLETALKRRNGSLFDVQLEISAVRGPDDALLRTHATVIDISASKRAQAKVRAQAANLRAMSQRIVEIQEREQRSLSAELHDRIGQDLAIIGLDLHILKDQLPQTLRARAGARLDDAIARLESTAEIVRDVAGKLHPLALDDYGLAVTLRAYAEQFSARTGIRVLVEADHAVQQLPRQAATTLYRVTQEAFTNVLEHAGADTIRLRLDLGDRQVRLMISDNGQGFVPDARTARSSRSLGLLIMRERLHAVHGSLRIESRPGAGTLLTATIRRD